MKFYLGTHCLDHIDKSDIPLFISNRRLEKRKKKPFNNDITICIDSGGFSELSLFGKWKTSPEQYIENVTRAENLGLNINWIASQDWMCEDIMLKKTGLTVLEHQIRTIDNYEELLKLNSGFQITPVVQGKTLFDYLHHIELYYERGHNLSHLETVGVGSVCRRQNTKEIEEIMRMIYLCDIKIHGFGVKSGGLNKYSGYLHSADSLAWSYNARRTKNNHYCSIHDQVRKNKNCANCFNYAKEWYSKNIQKYVNL